MLVVAVVAVTLWVQLKIGIGVDNMRIAVDVLCRLSKLLLAAQVDAHFSYIRIQLFLPFTFSWLMARFVSHQAIIAYCLYPQHDCCLLC